MSTPILLRCLGGRAAPEVLLNAWARYQTLPEAVRTPLWDLVAGGIVNPVGDRFRVQVGAFCEEFGLEESDLEPVLQACGALLSQAAALDLSREQLREDLSALSTTSQEGINETLARFETLKAVLRESMLVGSLADHGKVLLGIDWRVDRVASSNRAAQIETSVVFLTLRYREAEREDRITLQLSANGIRELRGFLERFES